MEQRMQVKKPAQIIKELVNWEMPLLEELCIHGDMPGDKVHIQKEHIQKAGIIFQELLRQLPEQLKQHKEQRVVIAVCGGSGVGKSEIASILSYFFEKLGIGSYTLSGDNYPHRIPKYNDAERLRVFRNSGLKHLIQEGLYTEERFKLIQTNQKEGNDADKRHCQEHEWYDSYLEGGIAGLKEYLGTPKEIAFEELQEIVSEFKNGSQEIWLKRMGREECELFYEKISFAETSILMIEWTHGNSDYYKGVDIPVFLNSTPKETLAHRRERSRDGQIDSPFTMRVLEIEQEMLQQQAHKSKIIMSKQGSIITQEAYQMLNQAE